MNFGERKYKFWTCLMLVIFIAIFVGSAVLIGYLLAYLIP